MRIAVYGATGFVGSVLVGRLLSKGHEVIAFDNCYKPINTLLTYFDNKNFTFKRCDIRYKDQVEKSFQEDFEALILLSGIVGLPACDKEPKLAAQVNVTGWKNVCELKGSRKLVGASTGSCYGAIKDGLCTEETECNPLSLYGKTKLEGEQHLLKNGGRAFRFATGAGVSPSLRLNLLPNYMTHAAINTGRLEIYEPEAMRTFIDIRDFADVLIWGVEKFDRLSHNVYNAGDASNNCSKRQIAEYISEKTGCELVYKDGFTDPDQRDYAVDYSRLNNDGFTCQHNIYSTINSLLRIMPFVEHE